MQHEMLPMSVDTRQARAADVLRLFPPSRWHIDRIHALTHQFSQRVTPARDRMTFRHKTNGEARRMPRSPELRKKSSAFVRVRPGQTEGVARSLRHLEMNLEQGPALREIEAGINWNREARNASSAAPPLNARRPCI
jgi:hypothetical protein